MLVLMIKLLKDLSNSICCKHWIRNSHFNYVHQCFWIWAFVTNTILQLFVTLIKSLDFSFIHETLPIIWPALSKRIINIWARLTICVFISCDIILAIPWHVYLKFSKNLFVLNFQIVKHTCGKRMLKIETVFHPVCIMRSINKFWTACYGYIYPLIFVCPSSKIWQNLRLTTSLFTP